MRIGIKIGATITWIAGDPAKSEREHPGAGNLIIAGEFIQQPNSYVRSPTGLVRDRENLLTTVSFTTARQFATVEAAEQWAADYDTDMPRVGTLVLQSVPPSPAAVSYRYLQNAVIQSPRRQVVGVSVLLSYTVRGSNITTS